MVPFLPFSIPNRFSRCVFRFYFVLFFIDSLLFFRTMDTRPSIFVVSFAALPFCANFP